MNAPIESTATTQPAGMPPVAEMFPATQFTSRSSDWTQQTTSRGRDTRPEPANDAAPTASRLDVRVREFTEQIDARTGTRVIVGDSPEWKRVLRQAVQVAETDTTVLLLGESGTGKEVIARLVHRASPRKAGRFVAINCAALPEQLLESELFGCERGAFTGATHSKAGLIEQASGGTLFLDEVGEMSPTVQAKLLRVLQEREFQRLGGSRVQHANIRIVAATHRDLQQCIERGQFREDLYYRLSVFPIELPPLRDRSEDIVTLADAFVRDISCEMKVPPTVLAASARQSLRAYHWPGNVRELRNAIARAVIVAEGGPVTRDHLPVAVRHAKPAKSAVPEVPVVVTFVDRASIFPPGLTFEAIKRDLMIKAMAQANNNKSEAAKLLGVPRGQLYSMLRRHGLTDAKR